MFHETNILPPKQQAQNPLFQVDDDAPLFFDNNDIQKTEVNPIMALILPHYINSDLFAKTQLFVSNYSIQQKLTLSRRIIIQKYITEMNVFEDYKYRYDFYEDLCMVSDIAFHETNLHNRILKRVQLPLTGKCPEITDDLRDLPTASQQQYIEFITSCEVHNLIDINAQVGLVYKFQGGVSGILDELGFDYFVDNDTCCCTLFNVNMNDGSESGVSSDPRNDGM